MYSVHCTLHNVHDGLMYMFGDHQTLDRSICQNDAHCTMYSVHHIVQCSMYIVHDGLMYMIADLLYIMIVHCIG